MLIDDIKKLKEERNAVILAHFYQNPEVQDVADFVGDSLALSRKAAETDADVIVFCGVYFMAETAKILSPEKTVLLPKMNALCNMAQMISYDALKQYKEENPDRMIVTYVNTRAEIKALSDIIVTSSNAEKIVSNFKDRKIMYTPDKNLGLYLKDKLKIDIDVWPGHCYIHDRLTINNVKELRKAYPEAELLVHPEAPLDVVKLADYAGSTKGILDYATNSDSKEFIIGTDKGIIHKLQLDNPDKTFHILSQGLSCYNMKTIKLEDVYNALKLNQHVIEVDENISKKARVALDEMLRLS